MKLTSILYVALLALGVNASAEANPEPVADANVDLVARGKPKTTSVKTTLVKTTSTSTTPVTTAPVTTAPAYGSTLVGICCEYLLPFRLYSDGSRVRVTSSSFGVTMCQYAPQCPGSIYARGQKPKTTSIKATPVQTPPTSISTTPAVSVPAPAPTLVGWCCVFFQAYRIFSDGSWVRSSFRAGVPICMDSGVKQCAPAVIARRQEPEATSVPTLETSIETLAAPVPTVIDPAPILVGACCVYDELFGQYSDGTIEQEDIPAELASEQCESLDQCPGQIYARGHKQKTTSVKTTSSTKTPTTLQTSIQPTVAPTSTITAPSAAPTQVGYCCAGLGIWLCKLYSDGHSYCTGGHVGGYGVRCEFSPQCPDRW